jgi:hypothetical protein
MPMRYLLIFGGLLLLGWTACKKDDYRDIKAYYYPALDLQSGQVYGYEMTMNGQTVKDYWYFRAFARDSGLFLSATNYDDRFHINQISTERIEASGALARSYYVYEQDSATQKALQTTATITAPAVFPFKVKDSLGVFLFSLHYRPIGQPAAKLYLIRNRYYLGDAPDFELEGQKYPCIRMGIREAIGNENEGASEIEGKGEEWYAKGIGLVYARKAYGEKGALVREYRLKERFGMAELERRAGPAFGQ